MTTHFEGCFCLSSIIVTEILKPKKGQNMKLLSWPDYDDELTGKLTDKLKRDVSVRNPGGNAPCGVGGRRISHAETTIMKQTMIKSQGDSNLCASISVSNVLSYALRRYLLEENVIPDRDHWTTIGQKARNPNP